jgi:hypothetical protein
VISQISQRLHPMAGLALNSRLAPSARPSVRAGN